jgi:hypothetical protein
VNENRRYKELDSDISVAREKAMCCGRPARAHVDEEKIGRRIKIVASSSAAAGARVIATAAPTARR